MATLHQLKFETKRLTNIGERTSRSNLTLMRQTRTITIAVAAKTTAHKRLGNRWNLFTKSQPLNWLPSAILFVLLELNFYNQDGIAKLSLTCVNSSTAELIESDVISLGDVLMHGHASRKQGNKAQQVRCSFVVFKGNATLLSRWKRCSDRNPRRHGLQILENEPKESCNPNLLQGFGQMKLWDILLLELISMMEYADQQELTARQSLDMDVVKEFGYDQRNCKGIKVTGGCGSYVSAAMVRALIRQHEKV